MFRGYLALAGRLLATHGAALYPGAALAELAASAPARVLTSRVCHVKVPVERTAELFVLNLAVWRSDPAVEETPQALDRLTDHLDELRRTGTGEQVGWSIRQLALERMRRDQSSPPSPSPPLSLSLSPPLSL